MAEPPPAIAGDGEPPVRGSCATRMAAAARRAIAADVIPAITPFLVFRRPIAATMRPGISEGISKSSARRTNASRISGSLVFIAVHLLPHALEPTGHGGLHRADPAAEHLGDLPLREVFVEAQDDRRTLSVRELLERPPDQ